MIMGSRVRCKIGDRVITSGPQGAFVTGTIPAVILREATKEEYIEDMSSYSDHSIFPPQDILNSAFFYEVSVD